MPATGFSVEACQLREQVGAQNAGKSSLVNAMRRAVGHKKPQEELTTAAMPGTTLGAQATVPQCCWPLSLQGPQKGPLWAPADPAGTMQHYSTALQGC